MNLSSPAAVSALLRRHNLRPMKRHGQNFLVDANTLAKIADAGEISLGDQVMEIGGGLGVLTQQLAERVGETGRVVTVEIDRKILPVLEETVGPMPQVCIVSADALAIDLAAFVPEHFAASPVRVVANIPYNITSPLLANLLTHKSLFSLIVLLVQKEVAQRLTAKPGTSDWGAFSVFAQYHAEIEVVGMVPPTVFFPPPDVTSAIIRLRPRPSPPVQVADETLFFAIVRAAFGQRRKTLLNALSNDPALGWTKERALAALENAGIGPTRRGETLTLDDFGRLANAPLVGTF
jgi:16S rRNA (adenine1518-N6/adenine1519-N6)-dimethyltransferase